jgi:hypothetical protein
MKLFVLKLAFIEAKLDVYNKYENFKCQVKPVEINGKYLFCNCIPRPLAGHSGRAV